MRRFVLAAHRSDLIVNDQTSVTLFKITNDFNDIKNIGKTPLDLAKEKFNEILQSLKTEEDRANFSTYVTDLVSEGMKLVLIIISTFF